MGPDSRTLQDPVKGTQKYPAWLKIHQHGTRHVASTRRLVEKIVCE